jgi:fermentation-respiration switch protein FrsA (DUF1100 family)
MTETPLEILSDGLNLKAVLQAPANRSWPLVIFCHGLLSHKDGSKYRALAQVLAREGIATLRFDFRGCGESEGRLEESTVSGRWRDLQGMIEWCETLDRFDGRLGILGSSMGGYLALLESSRNPKVRCVAAWSTPSHLNDLADRLPEAMPVTMSREFYEDLRGVQLLPRLGEVQRVLIMHGRQDHLVPVEHACTLFSGARDPKMIYLMNDADHRFSQSEARQQAIRQSLDWFRRFL